MNGKENFTYSTFMVMKTKFICLNILRNVVGDVPSFDGEEEDDVEAVFGLQKHLEVICL